MEKREKEFFVNEKIEAEEEKKRKTLEGFLMLLNLKFFVKLKKLSQLIIRNKSYFVYSECTLVLLTTKLPL